MEQGGSKGSKPACALTHVSGHYMNMLLLCARRALHTHVLRSLGAAGTSTGAWCYSSQHGVSLGTVGCS